MAGIVDPAGAYCTRQQVKYTSCWALHELHTSHRVPKLPTYHRTAPMAWQVELVLKEKTLSFSGDDFVVTDAATGQVSFRRARGRAVERPGLRHARSWRIQAMIATRP